MIFTQIPRRPGRRWYKALRKIYEKLKMIRLELQAIRNGMEPKADIEIIGRQAQERLKEES